MSEYLLLLLMAVVLLIMLFIKCLGKYQEVYRVSSRFKSSSR